MDPASDTETGGGPGEARFAMSRWRLVAAAAIVAAFAFQGSRGLWDPDEGRYAEVAEEMLHLGDFLVPHSHHELPHLTKPPLTYWVIAGSVRLMGRNEWAVRLPYALAFAAAVLLLYRLGRRLVPDAPWLPAAIYGTSFLPFLAANAATTDTLLTLWEILAVAAFVDARWCHDPRRRRAFADLMWLGWGLAFLTKGPPGMLPLAAILVFVAAADGRAGLRRLVPTEGLALFLVVGLGWYAILVAHQPELLSYFLGYELAGRLFSGAHHRNAEWYGAIKIYLPSLLVGSLPWTPWLLRAAGRRAKAAPRARWWTPGFWRRLARRDPTSFFLLLWLLLPLLVFCVARSRLPFYVLPLAAPIALLVARRLRAEPSRIHRRWLRLSWVWLVALLALKAGLAQVGWKNDARALADAVREQVPGAVDEIVFAETWPRLGLGFYLGSEVEVVTFYDQDPHPLARSATSTLAAELAGPAEGRLFVAARPHDAAFERVLGDQGCSFRRRGGWHDLVFYTVEAGSPDRD